MSTQPIPGNTEDVEKQAALYVRMSTDMQSNSLEVQIATLNNYAEKNELSVVEVFSDPGVSGLSFDKRPGLKRLIDVVKFGKLNFKHILVYDVSRWGRFQDIDEGAHYEFLCRQAGIKFHYVTEYFPNENQPLLAVLKTMKRSMAAEYSRELSAKLIATKRKLFEMGYITGVSNVYGYRRACVSKLGEFRCVLEYGQRKLSASDRLTMVLGPPEEVKIVQWMYERFVKDEVSFDDILKKLKKRKVAPPYGRPKWTPPIIKGILSNEIYIGTHIYRKGKVDKVGGDSIKTPVSEWERIRNHWPQIIHPPLFSKVQTKISRLYLLKKQQKPSTRISNESLLDALRLLLKEYGYLSRRLIQRTLRYPKSYRVITTRFGSLPKAYDLIGYKQPSPSQRLKLHQRIPFSKKVITELIAKLKQNGLESVILLSNFKLICVANKLTIALAVLWHHKADEYLDRSYRLTYTRTLRNQSDLMLFIILDKQHKAPAFYYFLPSSQVKSSRMVLSKFQMDKLDKYRLNNLNQVCSAICNLTHSISTPIEQKLKSREKSIRND